MNLVRGTNVYARAVEAIVREYEAIDEFQIHLYTAEGIRDEIEVLVEVPEPPPEGDAFLERLSKELAEAHEGLGFHVRETEVGSLPRFELKAKRVLDEREIAGGGGERKQA
jgi:phenylacetate-CoA ligase